MKIQHIRRNNQFLGTLVAVKDEKAGEIKIGFCLIMKCDQITQNFSKKGGVTIAVNRALRQTHNKVPKKIEPEFREFVSHCSEVSAFRGFKVPSPDDFTYSFEPIHQHKSRQKDQSEKSLKNL